MPDLREKVHIDTFYMPRHSGYRYVVHAVCSLTAWPEAKALKKENGRTIGNFIFEHILCRFGAVAEIVTDNGLPFINALDYLSEKFHINHIKISPYNSQAQGVVERAHFGLRESLVKLCGRRLNKWPELLDYALWSQRITTKKGLGYSPYYMVHGVEPQFPFDFEEASWLAPGLVKPVATSTLIAIRARQLEKRSEDIDQMRKEVHTIKRKYAGNAISREKMLRSDGYFEPGDLVLVRNSREEAGLKNKYKPQYLGPYIVVYRSQGGAYTLAEMDGSISKLKFAAKRLVPFYLRSRIDLPNQNELLEEVNRLSAASKLAYELN